MKVGLLGATWSLWGEGLPQYGANTAEADQRNIQREPSICTSRFVAAAAAAAVSLQSCLTLCNPIDGNPPGSPVPGILQARTLEWVAISFSNERK